MRRRRRKHEREDRTARYPVDEADSFHAAAEADPCKARGPTISSIGVRTLRSACTATVRSRRPPSRIPIRMARSDFRRGLRLLREQAWEHAEYCGRPGGNRSNRMSFDGENVIELSNDTSHHRHARRPASQHAFSGRFPLERTTSSPGQRECNGACCVEDHFHYRMSRRKGARAPSVTAGQIRPEFPSSAQSMEISCSTRNATGPERRSAPIGRAYGAARRQRDCRCPDSPTVVTHSALHVRETLITIR